MKELPHVNPTPYDDTVSDAGSERQIYSQVPARQSTVGLQIKKKSGGVKQ